MTKRFALVVTCARMTRTCGSDPGVASARAHEMNNLRGSSQHIPNGHIETETRNTSAYTGTPQPQLELSVLVF